MSQGIAERDKPMTAQEALDWGANGCYNACQECKAWQSYEKISQCTDCGIEKARQFVVKAQQKILNGGGRCA